MPERLGVERPGAGMQGLEQAKFFFEKLANLLQVDPQAVVGFACSSGG